MLKHGMLMAVVLMMVALTALGQTSQPANQVLANAVKQAADARDTATALAKSQELEASAVKDAAWADNVRTQASLIWKSGKHTEAAAFLTQRAAALADETQGLSSPVPERRKAAIVNGCLDLAALEAEPAAKVSLARTALAADGNNNTAFTALRRALFADKKLDDALQACLDYMGKADTAESCRLNRVLLLMRLNRPDDLKAEALEYLKVSSDVAQATKALVHLLPADDVALCCGLTAQQVLDGRKVQLRGAEGKLNSRTLLALADQLTNGGSERPLRMSDEAKALSEKLADAKLAAFLVPLLKGDYTAAFREAYARAKSARNDPTYIAWVNAAAGTIRCRDQSYNGKALEFVKFVNGTVTTNPASDMVSP